MSNVDLAHMQASLDFLDAKDYMPGTVAWNDGDRGMCSDGQLSCFGSNNTDAKLYDKDGRVVPYLKANNYNERLGVTTADRVVMGVKDGKEVTAQEVLESIAGSSKRSGFKDVSVSVAPQQPVVVRFQNAFVPFRKDEAKKAVVVKHYSYQTFRKDDPRNLLVCGHSGGIDVQADDRGENPLYSLEYKPDGTIDRHYYTVEPSSHAVGVAQTTGDGRAQPPELGLKGMGPRGNAFCIMSIPNKQKANAAGGGPFGWNNAASGDCVYRSLGAEDNVGTASAAVLGVEDESMGAYDAGGASIEYDPDEAIVITILLYNAVQDTSGDAGAPIAVSSKDVAMAVGDMDKGYNLCNATGYLSELPWMLKSMTKEMMDVVKRKRDVDPPPASKKMVFDKTAAAKLAMGATVAGA
jgi:hypothetical protein